MTCALGLDYYQRLRTMLLLPVVAPAVLAVLPAWLLWRASKTGAGIRAAARHLAPGSVYMTATMVVWFLIYPTVASAAMGVFRCMDVEGVSYLVADFRVQCGTPTHTLHAAAAALVLAVFVVGAPAAAFAGLYRHRFELGQTAVRRKYLFLFNGYSPQAFYWETVSVFRKAALAACITLLTGPGLQALCVLAIMCATVAAHMHVRPFASAEVGQLENSALLAGTATMFVATAFLGDMLSEAGQWVCMALLVLLNGLTAILAVRALRKATQQSASARYALHQRRKRVIQQAQDKLSPTLELRTIDPAKRRQRRSSRTRHDSTSGRAEPGPHRRASGVGLEFARGQDLSGHLRTDPSSSAGESGRRREPSFGRTPRRQSSSRSMMRSSENPEPALNLAGTDPTAPRSQDGRITEQNRASTRPARTAGATPSSGARAGVRVSSSLAAVGRRHRSDGPSRTSVRRPRDSPAPARNDRVQFPAVVPRSSSGASEGASGAAHSVQVNTNNPLLAVSPRQ